MGIEDKFKSATRALAIASAVALSGCISMSDAPVCSGRTTFQYDNKDLRVEYTVVRGKNSLVSDVTYLGKKEEFLGQVTNISLVGNNLVFKIIASIGASGKPIAYEVSREIN